MTRPRTLAQLLMRPAPKKPAPAPAPAKAPRIRADDWDTGINARDLSPEDYERRLAQLGLSAPGAEHRRLAPPIDPEVRRVARRDLDRAERRVARESARAQEARAAEVSAGAIDARTATPDEVRARIAALGADAHSLAVRPVGRELEPSRDRVAVDAARAQQVSDREVAQEIHRAMQQGRPVDARKLTPGELRELLALRGAGM